jgi:hypothetical protein
MARRPGRLLPWAFVVASACSGPQEPGGEGSDCYRDRDCQSGLVCVGTADDRRCSSDVSGLVTTVEGAPPPADAGMPPADAADPDAG